MYECLIGCIDLENFDFVLIISTLLYVGVRGDFNTFQNMLFVNTLNGLLFIHTIKNIFCSQFPQKKLSVEIFPLKP